jgi:hypothetical protein
VTVHQTGTTSYRTIRNVSEWTRTLNKRGMKRKRSQARSWKMSRTMRGIAIVIFDG